MAGAAVVAGSIASRGGVYPATPSNTAGRDSAELAGKYEMLRMQFLTIAEDIDPGEALRMLVLRMRADPVAARFCHELTHEIGRAAYDRYHDFAKAMGFQNDACVSGYEHGVMEAIFSEERDREAVAACIGVACAVLPAQTYDRWACFHGIGHGLMFGSMNDLPASIARCGAYGDAEARDGCTNGAYMENFNADAAHPSRFVRVEDPFFPCLAQEPQYRFGCAMNTPIQYLKAHGDDVTRLRELCANAPSELWEGCFSARAGKPSAATPCMSDLLKRFAIPWSAGERRASRE